MTNLKTKSKWLAALAALLMLIALMVGVSNISTSAAYAAVYSNSGKYKLDISASMQLGTSTVGYYEAYLIGDSTSTSTTTISDGAILKFAPKKAQVVIPQGSTSSYHKFYGRVYDFKISGPVAFSSSVVNSGSVSESTTLDYSFSGLTDGSYTLSFTTDEYYYSSTIGGTTSRYTTANTVTFNFIVDTTAPTISGASTSTTGKYTNSSFTVSATDSASGVSALYYKSPTANSYSSASGGTYAVSSGATNGLYRFYATDKAGNKSSTYYAYLDTIKPTGTLYAGASTISSGSTTTEDYIKFVASDSLSGVKTVYVKTPGSSSYVTCASGSQYSSKGSYSFYCVDNAGNTSSTYTVSLNEAHVHSYTSTVTAPTCTSGGYTTYTCSCGDSHTGDVTEALGHNYIVSEQSGATCGEGGYKVYTCSRCGDQYEEYGAGEGHTYYESTVEPTCTESGYILHKCTKCGYEYKSDETEALGHNYNTQVTKAATCTTDGKRVHTCSRCGDRYTTIIPATGHNYSITAETNDGGNVERTYTCSDCGNSYTEELGEQYAKVSNYVEYLFEQYAPYMWWVLLATASIWSIVMGVMIIIAQKNEEKAKAKRMLVNYFIGLVVIAVIVVACPYLVRGIAALVT